MKDPQELNQTATEDISTIETVSIQDFRNAMTRFGAAVHVVTTNGPAGLCGFTGSAVCSVSDNPPTILTCLNRASKLNEIFKENGAFCINTLNSSHEELSNCFAGYTQHSMPERFEMEEWDELETSSPALVSALVSLDCTITAIEEVATHSVMFGRVRALRIGTRKPALVYLDRTYRSL
jgi:flavin reductase (DIM6/NTAB) family NADH-FMN oxidoreductase RutF